MLYSNLLNQKKKSVPTLFLIIYLVIVFFGLNNFFLGKKFSNQSTKAREKDNLDRIQIMNVTEKTASIYWQTRQKTSSWILFGENENQLTKSAFDERDFKEGKTDFFNHFVSLKNLKPGQTYYFVIVTPQGIIKRKNKPFFFNTKKQPSSGNTIKPLSGRVVNKKNINDGVIILEIEGADPLGNYIKESGEWIIPLYYITRKGTADFLIPDKDTHVKISILNGKHEKSEIKTLFGLLNSLPEEIILGKDYIFMEKGKEKVLSRMNEADKKKEIEIIFPKENSAIPGKKPLIKGIAKPEEKIKVYFDNPKQIYEIYSDRDGIWQLSPFYDLLPGKHELKIVTKNFSGKEIEMRRSFIILKSGESVLGEATPSANISPTTPVYISPTSIVFSPTPDYQSLIEPTISYLSPTLSSPPVSGINYSMLIFLGSILIIFGLGFVLIF